MNIEEIEHKFFTIKDICKNADGFYIETVKSFYSNADPVTSTHILMNCEWFELIRFMQSPRMCSFAHFMINGDMYYCEATSNDLFLNTIVKMSSPCKYFLNGEKFDTSKNYVL